MPSASAKTGGVGFTYGRREEPAKEKPKTVPERGLFAAFIVLLAWALYVALGGVNWVAVSHTIRALLAAIW